MKIFKLKPAGYPGPQVITVETGSEFLIGLDNGDSSAEVSLFDNGTEIRPEDEKYLAESFTTFKFTAPSEPCQKFLVGTFITPSYKTTMNIVVRVIESSVSYVQRVKDTWNVKIVRTVGPESTDDEVATAKCVYREIARLESEIAGMDEDAKRALDLFHKIKDNGLRIRFYRDTTFGNKLWAKLPQDDDDGCCMEN